MDGLIGRRERGSRPSGHPGRVSDRAARLIGGLVRLVRDVGLAEELAQDALVVALERWPAEGRAAQSRRLADGRGQEPRDRPAAPAQAARAQARRDRPRARARAGRLPDYEEALDDEVGDDLLRLIFVACHPVLPMEGRTALTLRLLCGLTTEEIARAFLVPEPTVAQRIVRAKRTLASAGVPFEVPRGEELGGPAGLGAGGGLPRLQRGLRRHGGRRPDPAGAVPGGAAAGADPGAAGTRGARGARARRADGAAGLAAGGTGRPGRRAGAAARPGPAALGPAADPARARGPGAGRASWAGPAGCTRCRPRSPPAMRGRPTRRRPTGAGSRRSTASSRP